MAEPKTKRSGQKQSAHINDRRFMQFLQVRGKRVEAVELLTAPDYNTISINFQDKTSPDFQVETGFTVKTDYPDWKSGEQPILRKWPLIKSSAGAK